MEKLTPAALKLICLSLLLLLLSAVVLCNPASAKRTPEVLTIYTTEPWLTNMSKFIVGTTINVQPLSAWSESGALLPLRKVSPGSIVIATDAADAAKYGFKQDRKNLYLLYRQLPVKSEHRGMLSFDPSVLPFFSQRLLVVLSKINAENYHYYQRRLAEFQSRMESTLEVGRSLLLDVKLLDLTGASSPWVRAATDGAVRPPDDLWGAWSAGDRLQELSVALAEAKGRNWWIVVDAWTPGRIRSMVMGVHKNIYIKPPGRDQDFFTYMHDIYLELWSEMQKGQ